MLVVNPELPQDARSTKYIIPHSFFPLSSNRAINLLDDVIWTSLILCTNFRRFHTYESSAAALEIGVYQRWSLRSKCCDKECLASVKEVVGNIHKRLNNVYGNVAVDMSNVGRRAKRVRYGGSRNSASRWWCSSSVKDDDRGILGLWRSDPPCCDAEKNDN
jgi:hypothetical protein